MANPTSKGLTIKVGTTLGCVSFELIRDLSRCSNTITLLPQDIDGSSAMYSLSMSACPIHHPLGVDPDIAHFRTCQTPYNHNPQLHDYPSCAESLHLPKGNIHHNYHSDAHSRDFNDNQHELMMKDYYSYNQDKMTAAQIRELKVRTFTYLSHDDTRLCMSDRNIVRKELDLDTDSVLSGNDRQSISDFFYSMRECLSTHDNPSVQNKSYVSLKPVYLKPFYIKPYLTHETEIKFVEEEMEKLCQMGILHRGSSEFISPIMLINKSHTGVKLNKAPEYRLVVDFKYLNSHLHDIKFCYPEIKHVLHKIGRHSSCAFSILDLKHAFHSINLTEESKQYTNCCASPSSPTYQYNKLSQGLNVSSAYFTSLMNDLLHELQADIREYIDCIIFTPDIKTHKKVLKSFMLMLKKYGMLLTINKIHTFRSKIKYMGLLLSSKDNLPTITPLGLHVRLSPLYLYRQGYKIIYLVVLFI